VTYELTDTARQQLEQIVEFIARSSTEAALRTLDDFVVAFTEIANKPSLGHFRSDLTDKPFRFYRVHRFLIVYAEQPAGVCIARIYGGAEDIRAKLGDVTP
jgi:plasmid stabilization system protein ParE